MNVSRDGGAGVIRRLTTIPTQREKPILDRWRGRRAGRWRCSTTPALPVRRVPP